MSCLRRVLLLGGIGAVLAVLYGWVNGFTWDVLGHVGQPRNVVDIDGTEVRIPLTSGTGTRLAPAVTPTTVGEHSFLIVTDDGAPVRMDPCEPVAWVLNPSGMPAGVEELLHTAMEDVSARSGLVFQDEGVTDEPARFDREIIQERYGERIAPLVIGWSDEVETPELAGKTAGLGGATSVTGAYGTERFLGAGVIILDSEDFSHLLTTDSGTALAGAVMRHELGHVLGLGHVDDPTELMHAENATITAWGPGDLQGLAIAGSGPCQS